MKRLIAILIMALMLLGGCARRVQVQTDPTTGKKEFVVNDRYRDILDSDMPAEAKERALKDLLSKEIAKSKSAFDWFIQIFTAGLAGFAAWQATEAARK